MNPNRTIAFFPGSFDPITFGHLEIIARASQLFDQVVVGVVDNPRHKNLLLSAGERIELIRDATSRIENVDVAPMEGLATESAKRVGASVIVKGIRTSADFEFESSMSRLNEKLEPSIDTVLLVSSPAFVHVSSSSVREIASYGGDVSGYVPEAVELVLKRCFSGESSAK